jgi:CDP-diglyceride synthetase
VLYDITAVVTCVVVAVFVLWDGKISKIEAYILAVCALVLGATSWVTNILQATVFRTGANAYVVFGLLAIFVLWKGPQGKARGYILILCGLVLGSTALVTELLPPLVNSAFDALAVLFAQGL